MSESKKTKKKSEIKSVAKFGIPVTLFFMFFLGFEFDNPFAEIEKKWWDFRYNSRYNYFNHKKNKKAFPKITISAIDENTVKKYGWPFKRRYYKKLFDNLNKLNVKVIGVDVLFLDPDRENPENDRQLISSLRGKNNIINLLLIEKEKWKIDFPIDGIIQYSALMAQAHADVAIDSDGHVRRMSPFYPDLMDEKGEIKKFRLSDISKYNARYAKKEYQNVGIPLLGAAAYVLYKDIPLKDFYEKWKDKKMLLNFRFPTVWETKQGKQESLYRYISVKDIIEETLTDEEKQALNGGITLVGATAVGAFDHYPSPFFHLPGVEFHATVIDNLLYGDYLRPVNFLIKLLFLLIAIWLPIFFISHSTKKITLLSIAYAFLLAFLSFYSIVYSLDIEFVIFFVALFVSYSYVMAYKSVVEGKEKRWIKNTFSQYLSPKVVNILTEDPSKLILGGEKRDMSVFFLDIAGFTSMSEKMAPEDITKLLNVYLSEITDIILKYDGVVDKYIGDCVMAFWNAPLEQPKHRTLSCLAAIDCIRKIKELNEKNSDHKTSVRIGINSGYMVVGNMGSSTRFSYTVIGDNVNLASRLEGANKFFHSKIMISEDVYTEARDSIVARFLGRIRVVGKAIPVSVYEPLYRKDEKASDIGVLFDLYQKGINLFYEKEYGKSLEYFNEAVKKFPDDGPSLFYKELAENYADKGDGNFDGVFNLTSK